MSGEYWLGGLGGIRSSELRNSAASDPVEVDRSIQSDPTAPTPRRADPSNRQPTPAPIHVFTKR